jgi:MFS superfamily sulfate permease-like transporter
MLLPIQRFDWCYIAIVASIETLLCIEASDRMDALKRYSNTNVELKAQGIGNIISSLLGGLPMTSVVVRTTAKQCSWCKVEDVCYYSWCSLKW